MHVDLYTKSILTIIALCLLVLVFRENLIVRPLAAQREFTCHGDMTANEYGGTRAKVGGYRSSSAVPDELGLHDKFHESNNECAD